MNANSHTDGQLLNLLREGEYDAFNEIYNRYWDKLLAIAFTHTRDQSTAEDIVQNLFVNLWKRKEDLRIDNLEHYLAKAIKFSVFKEYYRKRKRETGFLKKWSPEKEEDMEMQIEAKFLEEYIHGMVDKLPPKCGLVFKLSRIQHLRNHEIAERLEIAPKTVEAHLTKALKTIRQELNESGLLVILLLLSLVFLT